MYKVMIVDDEIYITVLISKLVNWSEFDMQIEAICNNGKDAYSKALETSFDLIILDVRMPGIDGISLMEKLRRTHQETRFIVISGHRSFDFIRGAIQNDAEDYLLKPINRDELLRVLTHTKEKLDNRRNDKEQLMRANVEREKMDENLRRHALTYLQTADLTNDTTILNSLAVNYNVRFDMPDFLAAAFVFDKLPEEASCVDDTMFTMVANILNTSMNSTVHEFLLSASQNSLLILVNYHANDTKNILEGLYATLRQLNGILDRMDHLVATLCISPTFQKIASFKGALTTLQRCAEARVVLGIGGIIRDDDICINDAAIETIYSEYKQCIDEAIHALRIESIANYLQEMLSHADSLSSEDTLIHWKLFRRVMRSVYEYLHRMELLGNTGFEAFCKPVETGLLVAYTPQIMFRVISEAIREKFSAYENQQTSGKRAEIRVSELYIREHYMEPISLSAVASIVNYNPIYFSMTFKRETGMGFSDYLTQVRIKEARKMLKALRLPIVEIAKGCGFDNAKYFSQVFRKNVGITPTEYRKRHINMESLAYDTETQTP